MIKKDVWVEEIKAENFLSLENATIQLGKFTVLVGLNASGKSNVVKAITLLSKLGRQNSIPDICRIDLKMEVEQLFHDLKKDLKIIIKMKVPLDLSYEITIDSGGHIINEDIAFVSGDKGQRIETLMTRNKNGEITYLKDSGEKAHVRKPLFINSFFRFMDDIAREEGIEYDQLLRIVRDAIGDLKTYSFNPDDIKAIAPSGFDLELKRNGSNLAQVLHTLLTHDRKKFLNIEETMRNLIPEIEDLNVPPDKGGQNVYITIREKSISEPLKYTNISDGTLRILAFATALYTEGTLIAFEEPENCVHPYLYETIVDLCKKAPCQVILTTHSPYLVDQVSPEDLRLVEKIDGNTTLKTVKDKEKVKKMLEEGLTLGEVWYSSELEESNE